MITRTKRMVLKMHQFKLGQYKGLNIRPEPMFSEADLDTAVTEAISNMSYRWAKKINLFP